jgi:iron-siderophore transport system permease protein
VTMTTDAGTLPADASSRRAGQANRVLRWRGHLSLRYSPRAMVVTSLIVLTTVVVLCVQMVVGDYPLTLRQIGGTLAGRGDPGEEFILYTLRLPRALTAVLVGMALGLSGAVFQSITRNPLGSPDIIGFTQGASLGAVLQILVFDGGQLQIVMGAVVGGLTVSLLVYVLAYRNGVQGYRLILVGIGITAILLSLVSYLLLRARIEEAQAAFVWLTGSLNARGWEHVVPVAIALAVLLPLSLAMSRPLRMLEMGDETAQALGVSVERSRLWLLLLGTLLCAVAVAAAGPVGFVALAAPQIAKRLTGSATVGLLPAAAMGALLLLASDLAAQRALAPTQLPVGVATVSVGGLYLGWLLFRENQSGRA